MTGFTGPSSPCRARWLNARARPVGRWLALAAGAGVLAGCAVIAQAGLIAFIVAATVTGGADLGSLGPAFAALAGAVVVRAGADWGRHAAGQTASARVRRRLRMELFDQLGALGPARLSGEHSAGLASRLVEQVDALDGYYARFLPQLALAVVVPLLILVVALGLDWIAGLVLILTMPLIPGFMALVGAGAERLNRQQLDALTRLSGHFLDRVRGLPTLRLFGRGADTVEEVRSTADAYRRRSMRTLRVAFLSSAVLEFFSSVAIAVVAIYVGFGLLGYIGFGPAPELTLFSGLFLLLLAPEFFQPLRLLAQHYHDRSAALGAAGPLAELLARPVRAAPVPRTARRARRAAALSLDAVTVAHPGRGRVLDNATLRVRAGARIAVVGPSGAGKTTLLQVLAGFVTPETGRVAIDGEPPGVPARAAWIGQRPFLAQGTIAENILLGRPWASAIDVREAAQRAGVLDFAARLPAGLDSPIGERGLGFSGGQAQRIAVARALLSDAPLLLLDEPTANLDAASERAVLEALRRLASTGRTLIMATHQPAARGLAHRVVTLRDGHIVDADARA